jgi:hypothetical protein
MALLGSPKPFATLRFIVVWLRATPRFRNEIKGYGFNNEMSKP